MANNVAAFYDRLWAGHRPEYGPSREHLESFFENGEIEGKIVLDAGCGSGIFSLIFAEKGESHVAGVDLSGGAVRAAESLRREIGIRNAWFSRADLLNLPFGDSSFDIVWAWGSVHHAERPMDALEELTRVLKKGGLMVLALYRKTGLAFIHDIATGILSRTPFSAQPFLAKVISLFLRPFIAVFRRREKARRGESLEHLVLDWFFVPLRRWCVPGEIRALMEGRGFVVEKDVGASGRFDSTSNFILKMRRAR